MKEFFVSVIVPTLNREKELCQTISLILEQDYPLFELLVIDQTDQHETQTEKFLENHKNKIRYFKLKRKNLPAARNFGIRMSRGEIILFLDDDVVPVSNLILAHVLNYQKPGIAAVAGRIVDKINPPKHYPFYGKILRNGNYLYNFALTRKMETETLSGANFSFLKSVVKKIGYFDENYTGNALCEDTDFGFRLTKAGLKIIFEPKAEVLHLMLKTGGCRKELKDEPRWYYDYFHNHAYFFFKNLNHLYFPLFLIRKRILGEWFKCILKGFLRWKNPLLGFYFPFLGIYKGYQDAKRVK